MKQSDDIRIKDYKRVFVIDGNRKRLNEVDDERESLIDVYLGTCKP